MMSEVATLKQDFRILHIVILLGGVITV